MRQRLLITGASGFVGQHAIAMADSIRAESNVEVIAASPALQILDPASIRLELDRVAPHAVLHLAAQSHVPAAFADPTRTLGINILGTQHLIDELRARTPTPKLIFVSSGDVYGRVPEADLPISEVREAEPRNPYAVSKRAGELLVRQWVMSHGLPAVIARPFNHIGARQSENFAVSGFARQIAQIIAGGIPPVLQVGDLAVTRDFTDVRDVVRAYVQLMQSGVAGETYNICSGIETSLSTVLDTLIALSGRPIDVMVDRARLRPNEQARAVGDAARIRALGWSPRYPLAESLAMILSDWQAQLARG
jgi:GDP-4-dehydro-6-deoxy-D-mannose reductase